MPWSDITKSDEFRSMSQVDRSALKQRFFERKMLPRMQEDGLPQDQINTLFGRFMERTDDTGEGLARSMFGSAAQSFFDPLASIPEVAGAYTGIESLEALGGDIRSGIESAFPVNPAQRGILTDLSGVGGQVAQIMATGGAGAAAGLKLAGRGATAAQQAQAIKFGATAAQQGAMGSSAVAGGLERAEQLGLEGGDRLLRGAIAGGTELLTEKLGGYATELGGVLKRTGQSAEGDWFDPIIRGVTTEAGEEGVAEAAGQATDIAMAPEAAPDMDLKQIGYAMLLGGAGGAMFGGVEAAITPRTKQAFDGTTGFTPSKTPPPGMTAEEAEEQELLVYGNAGEIVGYKTPQAPVTAETIEAELPVEIAPTVAPLVETVASTPEASATAAALKQIAADDAGELASVEGYPSTDELSREELQKQWQSLENQALRALEYGALDRVPAIRDEQRRVSSQISKLESTKRALQRIALGDTESGLTDAGMADATANLLTGIPMQKPLGGELVAEDAILEGQPIEEDQATLEPQQPVEANEPLTQEAIQQEQGRGQELQEPRELPVLPAEQAAQEPEAATSLSEQVARDMKIIAEFEASQPRDRTLSLSEAMLTPEKAQKLSDETLKDYLEIYTETIAVLEQNPPETPLERAQEAETRISITSAMSEGARRGLDVKGIMEREMAKRIPRKELEQQKATLPVDAEGALVQGGDVRQEETQQVSPEPTGVVPTESLPATGQPTPGGVGVAVAEGYNRPPLTLPWSGINSTDVTRQYDLPDDFYEMQSFSTRSDPAGKRFEINRKYRTPELDAAINELERWQGSQSINASQGKRLARDRVDSELARISQAARVGSPKTQKPKRAIREAAKKDFDTLFNGMRLPTSDFTPIEDVTANAVFDELGIPVEQRNAKRLASAVLTGGGASVPDWVNQWLSLYKGKANTWERMVHTKAVQMSVDSNEPVSASSVKDYDITLPQGYALNDAGDLYVFNATPPPQTQPQPATPATQETQSQAPPPPTVTATKESTAAQPAGAEAATDAGVAKPIQVTASLDQRGLTESGADSQARFSEVVERRVDLDTPDEQRSKRESQSGFAYGKAVRGEPLTQREVDSLPIRLPYGYVREGDLYIFKPEATGEKPVQAAPQAAQAVDATASGPISDSATSERPSIAGVTDVGVAESPLSRLQSYISTLSPKAQAAWTPERLEAAQSYYATGNESALEPLTATQRKVVKREGASDADAAAYEAEQKRQFELRNPQAATDSQFLEDFNAYVNSLSDETLQQERESREEAPGVDDARVEELSQIRKSIKREESQYAKSRAAFIARATKAGGKSRDYTLTLFHEEASEYISSTFPDIASGRSEIKVSFDSGMERLTSVSPDGEKITVHIGFAPASLLKNKSPLEFRKAVATIVDEEIIHAAQVLTASQEGVKLIESMQSDALGIIAELATFAKGISAMSDSIAVYTQSEDGLENLLSNEFPYINVAFELIRQVVQNRNFNEQTESLAVPLADNIVPFLDRLREFSIDFLQSGEAKEAAPLLLKRVSEIDSAIDKITGSRNARYSRILRSADGNIRRTGVKSTPARAARNSYIGVIPGVENTWLGTTEDFDAEFPDGYPFDSTRTTVPADTEALVAQDGRAFIFIDRVQVLDGDAERAEQHGTSPGVEAIKRLLRHESFVHRGFMSLPGPLKARFVDFVASGIIPEAELDYLANGSYPQYKNWRNDKTTEMMAAEEWLAQRVERMGRIPQSGPIASIMDWLRDVWRWLTGGETTDLDKLRNTMRAMHKALGALEPGARIVMELPDAALLRRSYIGERAIENLPEERKQFMRDSLDTAKAMAAAGKSSEEIRAVTGWFPGKYDGKMRWELPDNESAFVGVDAFKKAAVDTYGGEVFNRLPIQTIIDRIKSGNFVKLSDVFSHPVLFEAYPEAANIPFFPIGGNIVQGSHRIVDGSSVITATVLIDESGKISEESASVILHELQHYIQQIEGFAKGASPDSLLTKSDLLDAIKFRDAYKVIHKYRKQIAGLVDVMAREKAKTGFLGFGGPSRKTVKSIEDQINDIQDSVNAVWEAQGNALSLDRDSTRAALLSAINRVEDELGASWILQNRNEGLNRLYKRVAGEIEARDIQARQHFTPEQRAAIAPYSSENIAPEDAIVMFGDAQPSEARRSAQQRPNPILNQPSRITGSKPETTKPSAAKRSAYEVIEGLDGVMEVIPRKYFPMGDAATETKASEAIKSWGRDLLQPYGSDIGGMIELLNVLRNDEFLQKEMKLGPRSGAVVLPFLTQLASNRARELDSEDMARAFQMEYDALGSASGQNLWAFKGASMDEEFKVNFYSALTDKTEEQNFAAEVDRKINKNKTPQDVLSNLPDAGDIAADNVAEGVADEEMIRMSVLELGVLAQENPKLRDLLEELIAITIDLGELEAGAERASIAARRIKRDFKTEEEKAVAVEKMKQRQTEILKIIQGEVSKSKAEKKTEPKEGEEAKPKATKPAKEPKNKPVETAKQIINRITAKLAKTPSKHTQPSAVRSLYRKHLKNPMDEASFMNEAASVGLDKATAEDLYNSINLEIAAIALEAQERAAKRAHDKELKKAEKEAEKYQKQAEDKINEIADALADPSLTQDKEKIANPLTEIYQRQIKAPVTEAQFTEEVMALNVDEVTAGLLFEIAAMDRQSRADIKAAREDIRRREMSEAQASKLIYAQEEELRQGSKDRETGPSGDSINKAFREQVVNPMEQDAFRARLAKLKVSQKLADRLFTTAERIAADNERAELYKKRLAFLDVDSSALAKFVNELRLSGKLTGEAIKWRDLLSLPVAHQETVKAELLARVKRHEVLRNLSTGEQQAIADALNTIWQRERRKVFQAMIKKADLMGVSKEDQEVIVEAMPALLKYINQGMLGNSAFYRAVGEKFGIAPISAEARKQVEEMAAKMQEKDLYSFERAVLAEKILKILQNNTRLSRAEILSSVWVTSVLSGGRTIFDMALGVLNGGFSIAKKMINATIETRSPKAAIEGLTAFGQGIWMGAQVAVKNLIRPEEGLLASRNPAVADYFNDGAKGAGLTTGDKLLLHKGDAPKDKLMRGLGVWMSFFERLFAGLDHVTSTATMMGTMRMAAAINPKLYNAALTPTKQDYANAMERAKKRLPDGSKAAQIRLAQSIIEDGQHILERGLDESFMNQWRQTVVDSRAEGNTASYQEDPTGAGGLLYQMVRGATAGVDEATLKYRESARLALAEAGKTGEGVGVSTMNYFIASLSYLLGTQAQNLLGVRFMRFTGNKLNELISFIPVIGMARLREEGMFSGDQMTLRGKNIQANQVLGWMAAGIYLMLIDNLDEDDEERGWIVNGSWDNLTPERKSQLMSDGFKPNTVAFLDRKTGRWTSYNFVSWPFAGWLAAYGSVSDYKRLTPDKWNEKVLVDKTMAAAYAGAFAITDISSLSSLTEMFGRSTYTTDPAEGFNKRVVKGASNFVGGFIPKTFKDIDAWFDKTAYKPQDTFDHFAKEVPFYRRNTGAPLRDIFYEPVQISRTPWSRAMQVSPDDPAYKALAKLNSRGIWLTPANAENRRVKRGGKVREMTETEAAAYMSEVGKRYKDFIVKQGDRLVAMDADRAEELVSKYTARIRELAFKRAIATAGKAAITSPE